MKKLTVFFLLGFLSLGLGAQDAVLKIGVVDPDPTGAMTKLKPFLDYIGKKLGPQGINSASGIIAKDTNEMAALVRSGKVDVYIDSVYPVMEVAKTASLDLSLRRWKKGVGDYKTLFIAKKAGPIKDLTNLAGKKIGFEDPSSTSGRWLPTAYLADKGIQMVDGSKGAPGAGKASFVFTGSAENTPVWVLQGKIDLGVISNNDYDEMPGGLKGQIAVVGETGSLPRQIMALRSNLAPTLKKALISTLTGMSGNPEGQGVLKAWEKTSKIDEVTPGVLNTMKTFQARLKGAGY